MISNTINPTAPRFVPVIVIGGGPAGLAAAQSAKTAGASRVLLIERDEETGGILNQCIHDGFGMTQYQEALTGPEYAWTAVQSALASGVDILTGAMVTHLTSHRVLTVLGRGQWTQYQAGALVLAMGCRERARGAIQLPGRRPAGIFTAGVAQTLINTMNIMIGRRAVILGSGDIGLIMARRLTLEGVQVLAVLEKMPYPGGLPRNINQCLNDYHIPLLLNHTATDILGHDRVEGVAVSKTGDQGNPLPDTCRVIDCDTLILSVGLIPENELSAEAGVALDPATGGALVDQYLQTNIPGVFACGNALHVHDLADYAAQEGERAGIQAALFAALPSGAPASPSPSGSKTIPVRVHEGLRYVLPQRLLLDQTPQRTPASDPVLSFCLRAQIPRLNARVTFHAGPRALYSQSFIKLNPPEMVRITPPPALLSQLKHAECLEVSLEWPKTR
jgi:NADPH-dependent 2,4-dienoyl-CoA reductase/sulfur reductase-like enzyme